MNMEHPIKKKYLLLAFVLIPLFCELENRCWPKFSYGKHDLYLRKEILSNSSCFDEASQNHLLLDIGGFDGGGEIFVDLSDSVAKVIITGNVMVVGNPEFEYNIHSWGWPAGRRDSLIQLYSKPEVGKFYFRY